ncbi:MAG: hypothetical protein J6386_15610 [Candidatus Synoicihabitans palmerolidicus]|nr:hypothetical protein [Candidatus Synoicihabitans palmerolidicus]
MNIITDPSGEQRRGSAKVEFGSDGFAKFTGVVNTGLIDDKCALTIGAVTKLGDGYARGLWTDAKGYYVGGTWFVNDSNRIEFFAVGSPQEHGQRTFASNIAAYDANLARELVLLRSRSRRRHQPRSSRRRFGIQSQLCPGQPQLHRPAILLG